MPEAAVTAIPPAALKRLLEQGGALQIIDVRETAEYEAGHIRGSKLIPLSGLRQNASEIDRNRPAYLVCRLGKRSGQAARELEALGMTNLIVLEGGLEAWIGAGGPVEKVSGLWALERQVRFAAGALVLAGALLARLSHPLWIGLSVLVACGLIYSAVTDSCGMARLLAKMPWNRSPRGHTGKEMNSHGQTENRRSGSKL